MNRRILLVDSNAFYTKNDVDIVGADFTASLSQCRKYAELEVWIPRICLSEIMFQKCSFAQVRLNEAARALATVSKLAERPTPTVADYRSIARAVARRMLRWCKENRITIAKVPFSSVNWKRTVEAAIWHLPPFSPPAEDNEKGFKDALILETVASVCAQHADVDVTFVTNDKLLRSTAEARFAVSPRFSAYATMEDLLNHLKLAFEEKAKVFADALLKNAQIAFFQPDDRSCIYLKDNIPRAINEVGGLSLSEIDFLHAMDIALPTVPAVFPNLSSLVKRRWQAMSEDKFWISAPSYLNTDDDGWYHWRTEVTVVKLYRQVQDSGAIMVTPRDYIRIAPFSAFWKCRADMTAAISDPTFEKVTASAVKAEVATDALRRHYGLPTEIDLLLQSIGKTSTGTPAISASPEARETS